MAAVFSFSSCNDDDTYVWYYPPVPNALVTVKPIDGAGFYMQLDDSTTLYPVNMAASPYGDKEVRALVCYREVEQVNDYYTKSVEVSWIDSILTKMSVPYPADGPDCVEGGNNVIDSKMKELEPGTTISYEELQEFNEFRMNRNEQFHNRR